MAITTQLVGKIGGGGKVERFVNPDHPSTGATAVKTVTFAKPGVIGVAIVSSNQSSTSINTYSSPSLRIDKGGIAGDSMLFCRDYPKTFGAYLPAGTYTLNVVRNSTSSSFSDACTLDVAWAEI